MTWSITIELAWPDRRLSPNGGSRWGTYCTSRLKAAANERAFWATRAATRGEVGDSAPKGPLAVQIVAHPRTKRRRDGDNLIASLKASLDGIASALGVDDSVFRMMPPTFAEPEKSGVGRILVTVSEMKS